MELQSAAQRHRGLLVIVLGLTTTYMLAEVVGGIITGSLALIADAAHMLTDVFGLITALVAIWFAGRPTSRQRTYGYYRAEILGALLNAVVLFGISFYILYEAWRRFQQPPEVQSVPMMIVAAIGLVVNLMSAWLLHRASAESLNMRGAYLEVISDTLGSIGVIVAALIITFTGWYYADPLFSVAIGLFILPRTWKLLNEAVSILLEGTPSHIDVAELEQKIMAFPGVESVHDTHVWTISSGIDAMSGHVVISKKEDSERILSQVCNLLRETYKIDHMTIQVESSDRRQEEPAF